jgi:hypothetical protein
LEKEIISLFDSGVKKRKIAKTLDVSTSYIDRIILEKNKPKRIISPDEGFKIIAKCKKTGKFFEDYENKSGVLTNYIINNYSDFILPTSFKRRKFFKENNIFWYEEFFGFLIETNNKSILQGIELDIFVKEKNIAFEFNGLYFHSQNSGKKERLYHRNKTNFSNLKGIRLIHIFEDEWQNRKDIIKSKIKHILGVSNSNRIHTRELNIRNITRQEKDSFLELNHIQGSDESNISIGAFLNDKLYAVMSFDNNRSMNKGKDHNSKTYELKRFATDINYIIPGVASRFLKFFIKEFSPKRIISFADLRWTSPEYNLYNKLGFTLYETIHPDYSYTFYKSGVAYRFHKFGFGKKAIKRKFPDIYQDNKTEWEMMQEKGFDRIWDCGKLKYVMNL